MSNKIAGVPEGWELVGIRRAKKGEFSVQGSGTTEAKQWEFDSVSVYPIVRKLPDPVVVREGGYYRQVDGKVVGPIALWQGCKDPSGFYYTAPGGGVWNADGVRFTESQRAKGNIVAEVQSTYRPFASAEEFKPHRDKWLVPKECSDPEHLCFKVDAYCDEGYDTRSGLIGWFSMLRDFVFEDGTPCGVKQCS
jgi:hypothetical protein